MTDIEQGSGNVYADLEFPDAEGMLVKAQLVTKIADSIKQLDLTQQQAADIMGMSLGRASKMLRGHFHGVSLDQLFNCLTALGNDVEIRVKPIPRGETAGKISVIHAT